MLKTQIYNLNKPEAADPIRVDDFNENSDIIDAALGALNDHVYFGSWIGNGAKNRTIQLPFEPQFILVMGHTYNSNTLSALVVVSTQNCQRYMGSSGCYIGSADWGGSLSGDKFQMGQYPTWNNYNGETVYYMAVK